MLKGKPVKQLNDTNLNQSWRGTVHFRIRSLLIHLNQVFLWPLQHFHGMSTFRNEGTKTLCQAVNNFLLMAFPFHSRDITDYGMSPRKDNQVWSSALTFPHYTSVPASSDHIVVSHWHWQNTRKHHKKLCSGSGLNVYQPMNVPLSTKTVIKHTSKWAKGTLDLKILKQLTVPHILLKFTRDAWLFFFLLCVCDMNLWKLSFCLKPNKIWSV